MGQRENVYEMIAMYLTALPVPPLPVWVRMTAKGKKKFDILNEDGSVAVHQQEQDEEDEDGVAEEKLASSHDLLAGLLVAAMSRDRADLNHARMERQQALVGEFIASLDAMKGDVAAYYAACVRFTGGFVHAFCDAQQATPQVRFGELEQVALGDKVQVACAHWMSAQDIVHEEDASKRRTMAHFGAQPYAALLAARLEQPVRML
jgi:hypothetical protein